MSTTEKELRQNVIDLARTLGFEAYFSWTSIHSPRGFPDLTLAKEGRLVFAELKVGKNKPTDVQLHWLKLLDSTGNEAYLWTDKDWDEIVEVLNKPGDPLCSLCHKKQIHIDVSGKDMFVCDNWRCSKYRQTPAICKPYTGNNL